MDDFFLKNSMDFPLRSIYVQRTFAKAACRKSKEKFGKKTRE